AERFLDMGLLNEVTAVPNSVPDVGEPGPSQRFLHEGLLFKSGDLVSATSADEDRRAEKAAARVKPPVTFRHAFAADAGYLRSKVVRSTRLRRRRLLRQTFLCDPRNKNADNPITRQGQER